MPAASGSEPAGEARGACSVTEAMNAARRGLEQIRLTVIGEVSEVTDKLGYKAVYFTVRDDECAMSCIMWRSQFQASGCELAVGMLVELAGKFSCYTAKGRLQFSVARMAPAGEGSLRMRVAQLARKLEAEGLMDSSRKRPLRALPKRIAVVTSPHGKAVHDVLRTLRRRYPLAEVYVCGVQVEGTHAPALICEALATAAAAEPAPDVILLVRGGGSYEDLMPFNDEALARAVAASPVPVVTGIGHEPDNTLCDMVSDRRCSTPTAAAEAVSPTMQQLQDKLDNATGMLKAAYEQRVLAARHRLGRIAERPVFRDEHYLTAAPAMRLDAMAAALSRAIPDAYTRDAQTLAELSRRLAYSTDALLAESAERLVGARGSLARGAEAALGSQRARVALAAGKLDALSPLKVLARGYSIAYAHGGIVSRTRDVAHGDELRVQVRDGAIFCTVDSTERQGEDG